MKHYTNSSTDSPELKFRHVVVTEMRPVKQILSIIYLSQITFHVSRTIITSLVLGSAMNYFLYHYVYILYIVIIVFKIYIYFNCNQSNIYHWVQCSELFLYLLRHSSKLLNGQTLYELFYFVENFLLFENGPLLMVLQTVMEFSLSYPSALAEES
jgi:hypothetical protein